MRADEITGAVHAVTLHTADAGWKEKEYSAAFATDLMSDALAMIQKSPESTVLITGLCNAQVLRTAEMLDVNLVIIVRGKHLSDLDLSIADEMNISLFSTDLTLYETCGILYEKGLHGI